MPNSIDILSIKPLQKSQYIDTQQVRYIQKGVEKSWDIAKVHDSVAILLYDKKEHNFILVKQLRPAVYLKNGNGMTYELCAGIVDKDKSLVTIAKEEILEECGYDIDEKNIHKITSFYTSVGFAGSIQTLYYAYVDDSLKVSSGGGIETEDIDVVKISIKDVDAFILDESKVRTPGLMFAFNWFIKEKLS